jgi:tetratricopeptide (TPR) repeat protein
MAMTNFDSLWDYDNPAETGRKFRELLPEAEKSGDRADLAELLTQIARTEGLQMNYDEAHKILDDAEKIITGEMKKPRVRYLLERGRTFRSSKFEDEARPLFLEAYELAKANGFDYLQVDAAHMMGILEKDEESLKWNEIAIRDAEASNDKRTKGWLGSLCNNTGWTYHDMGEYDKALALFEKNVEWHTERKSKNEYIIAKWCVARCLRSMGKVEEAYQKQLALRVESEEMNLGDGFVHKELGECLLELGRPDEAKPYFQKAYEMLQEEKWYVENEKEEFERIKSLAE